MHDDKGRRNCITKVFFQTFHMFFFSRNNAITRCCNGNHIQPCGPSTGKRWTIYQRVCPGCSLLIICAVNTLSPSRTFPEAADEDDSHFHCTGVGWKLPCQRGCWREENCGECLFSLRAQSSRGEFSFKARFVEAKLK